MRAKLALWTAWFLIVFGGFSLWYPQGTGDFVHCLAYFDAMLGRPAREFHVRDLADWAVKEPVTADGRVLHPDDPRRLLPQRRVPYRDFVVEYPPGFLAVAAPPALVTSDEWRYAQLMSLVMATALTVAILCGEGIAAALPLGRPDLVLPSMLAAVVLLGPITVRRMDAAVVAFLVAALWATFRRKPVLAGFALGFAVAIKGLPVLAWPLLAMLLVAGKRWRELATMTASATVTGLAFALPALAVAGDRFLDAFRYHSLRPLEVGSTLAAVAGVAGAWMPGVSGSAVYSYGAANVTGGATTALLWTTSLLPALGIAAVLCGSAWRIFHATHEEQRNLAVITGLVTLLAAYFVFGKVFSPQYMTLLLPLGLIASLSLPGRSPLVLYLALALTQVIYPFAFVLLDFDDYAGPVLSGLVLARNLLLLAWATMVWVQAGRATARDGA